MEIVLLDSENSTYVPNQTAYHSPRDIWTYVDASDSIPYTTHFIVGIVSGVICVTGAVGNGCVVLLLTIGNLAARQPHTPRKLSKALRTPANFYIINLATADFLMSVMGLPLLSISSFHGRWNFGQKECDYYAMAVGITGLTSITTMAAIALDRYKVISRSLAENHSRKRKRAIFFLSLTWIYSILWMLPPMFGWNRFVLERIGTSCTFDFFSEDILSRSYVVALFVGAFIVPIAMIIVCYLLILKVVADHNKMLTKGDMIIHRSSQMQAITRNQENEIKIAKISATIVLVFCLAWLPYAVVALIGVSGHGELITPLVSAIPAIFAKSSAIYNPIIYAASHPAFRKKIFLKRYSMETTTKQLGNYTEEMKTFEANHKLSISSDTFTMDRPRYVKMIQNNGLDE